MKYVDEFRDGGLAKGIAKAISKSVHQDREYRFMEFCGGHTHAISRYGIQDLLPNNIHLIHGPGCPVCVLPIARIDSAIELVLGRDVILCTYGDLLRVPASRRRSLFWARAEGGDIRMVYSSMDALNIAKDNPHREVVFFAIGFETTTPPTAEIIQRAKRLDVQNFSVFCNHVLTPAAIRGILDDSEYAHNPTLGLDGIIGPSHVSTVIGSHPYEFVSKEYGLSVVISGFEPLDILHSILILLTQIHDQRPSVENQFIRAVTRFGNIKAQTLMHDVLEPRSVFEWRGLGVLPNSALQIKENYGDFDAERRFEMSCQRVPDHKGCQCSAILRGMKSPRECRLFAKVCLPENPLGACMVSSEGACAAHFLYGRYRDH